MYKNIAIALLIGSTEGINLSSFEKSVVQQHYVNKGWGSGGGGPGIAPVTFVDDNGCNDTYNLGGSRTAAASGCSAAVPAKVQDKVDKKQGKGTTEAKDEIDKKEVEAAKATIAEAKAPKAEATAPEAAFLQTDYVNKGWGSTTPGPGIAPVTFKDGPCTHTYDHSHSVTGGSPKACGAGGKEALEAQAAAKDAPKPKSDADKASDARKDAKAADDAEATAAAKAKDKKAKAEQLVQVKGWKDPMAKATFLDSAGCTHEYVSPGQMSPFSCPKGVDGQQQGTHAPKKEPKKPESLAQYVNKGWGSTTPGPGPPALTFKDGDKMDEYDPSHSRSAAHEKWSGEKQPEEPAKKAAKDAQEEMKGPAEEKTEPDAEAKKAEGAKKEAAKDAPKKAEEAPAPKKEAEPKTPEGGKLKDEVYDDIRSVEASSAAADAAAKVVDGVNKEAAKPPVKNGDDPAPEPPAAFAQKAKKMSPGEAIDIPGFSPYDVTHDMVGKGVWKATAMDDPNPKEDKKILARQASEKEQEEGIKKVTAAKAAKTLEKATEKMAEEGEKKVQDKVEKDKAAAPKPKEGAAPAAPAAPAAAPAAFAQKSKKMHPGEPIEIKGFGAYDVTHDMTGKGTWKATSIDEGDPIADRKAKNAVEEDKAQVEGIKAKELEKAEATVAAAEKGETQAVAKKAEEKADAAKPGLEKANTDAIKADAAKTAAAFAQINSYAVPGTPNYNTYIPLDPGMLPNTFRDKNNCKHDYVSPRKVADFGLENPLDCSGAKVPSKGEEGSAHDAKAEKKGANAAKAEAAKK